MYTPKELVTSMKSPIRLGIQGGPGEGKTTAAITFPSPQVANWDNKLPTGTPSIPFWNDDFIYTLVPKKGNLPPNRRDAWMKWLSTNYNKFEPDQTFIVDSWTMLQGAFDRQTELEPSYTKSGEIDKFAFWKHKLNYSREVCELLQMMKCNIVVIAHEQRERDDQGNLTGKMKPLQQGSFSDAMPAYFTCWFGMLAPDEKRKILPDKYVWQIRTDNVRYANIDIVIPKELKYIEASYASYQALNNASLLCGLVRTANTEQTNNKQTNNICQN